jgi:hypothetical protein
MSELERTGAFENRAGESSFWNQGDPYGVRSWREPEPEEMGLPIWRMLYRLR